MGSGLGQVVQQKVYVDALRPYYFWESVRNEMMMNDTPTEHPEIFPIVLGI